MASQEERPCPKPNSQHLTYPRPAGTLVSDFQFQKGEKNLELEMRVTGFPPWRKEKIGIGTEAGGWLG